MPRYRLNAASAASLPHTVHRTPATKRHSEVSSGPVTDPRAYELRERYHRAFRGEELPVPVESIADEPELLCRGALADYLGIDGDRRTAILGPDFEMLGCRRVSANEPGEGLLGLLERVELAELIPGGAVEEDELRLR